MQKTGLANIDEVRIAVTFHGGFFYVMHRARCSKYLLYNNNDFPKRDLLDGGRALRDCGIIACLVLLAFCTKSCHKAIGSPGLSLL